MEESGLFGAMREAATLEDKMAAYRGFAESRQLANTGNEVPAGAFDENSPEMYRERERAANAFAMTLAEDRGMRSREEANRILAFDIPDGSALKIADDSDPGEREAFMQVLRRAMIMDVNLEELINGAMDANVGTVIRLRQAGAVASEEAAARGEEPAGNLFVGAFGGAERASREGQENESVSPLVHTIDMSDIDALSPAFITNAADAVHSQEVALAHEVRELITASLLNDSSKLLSTEGIELYRLAHQEAVFGEAIINQLIDPERVGRSSSGSWRNEDGSFTTLLNLEDDVTIVYRLDDNNRITGIDAVPTSEAPAPPTL